MLDPDPADAGAVAEGDGSLLELPTKLVKPDQPGWWLTAYPQAREAGGCFIGSLPRGESAWDGDDPRDVDGDRSRNEAARRARGKVRRYCTANRLNRFGTLTYRGEGCFDPLEHRRHLGGFFRRLRLELGGKPLPYLWAPEWHPGGHGLHAHFAVGRYIARGKLVASWPYGFVHIKLLGDLPVGSGAVEQARSAAKYLGKYVSKTPAAGSGLHRYEVAQGFQPKSVKVWGRTVFDALDEVSAMFGAAPSYVWNSDQEESWAGPPAGWASWPG